MKRWLPILALVVLSSTTTAVAQDNLVELKAALMSADYRGDLAQLEDLRKRAERWTEDPELGYLADYWRGYASWRIAINGASAKFPGGRNQSYLERAAADFESSIRKNDQFADAYAARAAAGLEIRQGNPHAGDRNAPETTLTDLKLAF
ncbi:MAG TPA: hypothetical protein VNA69_09510 [Thermoanaerobaculia bacterium]|nr:hypothetical protein [Thermoanaerobaculia bacterium]